ALSSVERANRLVGCLRSEDTEVCIDALRQLGYEAAADWDADDSVEQAARLLGGTQEQAGRLLYGGRRPTVTVFRGGRPLVPARSADLFVGNSGTTMRFLTAMLALGEGRYRLDGVPRMRERPIGDL